MHCLGIPNLLNVIEMGLFGVAIVQGAEAMYSNPVGAGIADLPPFCNDGITVRGATAEGGLPERFPCLHISIQRCHRFSA